MISKLASLLLVSILIGGCVTPRPPSYSPRKFVELAAPGGLIKVTHYGENGELMYQVQQYTLYYCAEVAQREGSPYFALYQSLPDALQGHTSNKVKPMTLLHLPHAEVYISLRKTDAPGLLSTSEVLTRMKPAMDKVLK